ncbi:MAG: hypothetical protein HQL13_07345 [Candidatus Omnitrophica bacterium]|nr:hypothetical protein [Candidatus Omnitrophota bacterium]
MKRFISVWIILSFLVSLIAYPHLSFSQTQIFLPVVGARVNLSSSYIPVLMKGLRVHPENPLLFDFIIDTGKTGVKVHSPEFKVESHKLIKYFLTALTIKEDDLWVNLSPYEKMRIIPDDLSKTELGQGMLAEDYILKQLTASLMYPEQKLGKEFWDRVYARAQSKLGTTAIPINSFNKVWIVADKAKVFERNNVGFIAFAHLKVMLEEDYLALSQSVIPAKAGIQNKIRNHDHLKLDSRFRGNDNKSIDNDNESIGNDNYSHIKHFSSNIIQSIIIPELEKEVNTARNFAALRQMFYSMILATWYKQALHDALLNQVYSNKGKTAGVQAQDPFMKEKIYEQYLKAYKKGVFNYIKEDVDPVSKEMTPHKYFSGGVVGKILKLDRAIPTQQDQISPDGPMGVVTTGLNELKNSAMIMNLEQVRTQAQESFEEQFPYSPFSVLMRLNGPVGDGMRPLLDDLRKIDPKEEILEIVPKNGFHWTIWWTNEGIPEESIDKRGRFPFPTVELTRKEVHAFAEGQRQKLEGKSSFHGRLEGRLEITPQGAIIWIMQGAFYDWAHRQIRQSLHPTYKQPDGYVHMTIGRVKKKDVTQQELADLEPKIEEVLFKYQGANGLFVLDQQTDISSVYVGQYGRRWPDKPYYEEAISLGSQAMPVKPINVNEQFFYDFGAMDHLDRHITSEALQGMSLKFLDSQGQMLPLERRKGNGAFGVTEVYFVPENETQRRLVAFQKQLKQEFGDKVYLVDQDRLHFTMQGLERQWDDKEKGSTKPLAVHSGLENIHINEGVIKEVREKACSIQTPAFKMQVAKLNFNPQTGIFWELRPYVTDPDHDPIKQRREAWGLPFSRPLHITAAYFTQEFTPQEETRLRELLASYQEVTHFGDIDVDQLEVIAYSNFAFNANQDQGDRGYVTLETVSLKQGIGAESSKTVEGDNAMKDPGGIDLNSKHMGLEVSHDGGDFAMHVDPALIEEFKRGHFSGLEAFIVKVTEINSVLPMMGLKEQ